jgi:biofilm PGA synthesis N-glycosyltransferase PgaC
MVNPDKYPKYIVVSPVRDEERHIELTIRSMVDQTVRPAAWVIVDDGSRDRTPEIVREYAAKYSFIQPVNHQRSGERHAGSRVVHAFNYGREVIRNVKFEFIVKLDCDLSFGPDYFEKLFEEFRADERLGIASGVYYEEMSNGSWEQVEMPLYHAFGACKVVRASCFQDIGGFVTVPGWDTVDEIRAWSAGWSTRHFARLKTKHHKGEGTGIGRVRTSRMHGEIYYVTGGDPIFLVFKFLHRLTAAPFLISAFALASGYLQALVTRKPLLVTRSEALCYRRLLRQRLFKRESPNPSLTTVHSGR